MEPVTQPLGHALESTVADGFGGLFGCGTSLFTLFLVLVVSCALNFYLIKSFFSVVKDATAALESLKEALHDDK